MIEIRRKGFRKSGLTTNTRGMVSQSHFSFSIVSYLILHCISYLEDKTNNWVLSKINLLVGSLEPLLATVKRWKLAWFGHVTCHDSLSKTILQVTFEGGRSCGW